MPSLLESVKNFVVPNRELNGKSLDHWNVQQKDPNTNNSQKGDDYWKETLSEKEFEVLRNKGTEAPKSSVYDKHKPKKGHYACRACGNPLYSFKHKFESGCGWPAFGKFVEDSIETRDDYSMRMKRLEIVCKRCQSHLGHVFAENNATKDESYAERHCVNGISIRFVDKPLPEGVNDDAKAINN